MKAARLDSLPHHGIGFDLETHLIQPGLVAPPIVCWSGAEVANDRLVGRMGDASEARAVFAAILESPDAVVCGANIAYDVICMLHDAARRGIDIAPQVFRMYDPDQSAVKGIVDGRVFDIQISEPLHAVANGQLGLDPFTNRKIINPETGKPGRYSLREVVKQVLGRDDAKVNDLYRMSYALLEGTPIASWPREAREYPIDDARNTLEAALAQAGHIPSLTPHRWPSGGPGSDMRCTRCGAGIGGDPKCFARERRANAHEISRQTYVAFCMNLGGAWGFHVNQASVDAVEAKYNASHDGKSAPFIEAGIIRANGSACESVLKQLTARAYGASVSCVPCTGTGKVPSEKTQGRTKVNCKACDGSALELGPNVPRTKSGEIGIGRDVLQESGNELLIAYAFYCEDDKIPKTYIPWLRGTDRDDVPHPGVPLNLRPNPILETGRTSYDGVVQLLPRSGGIRECIEARPGYVFSSEDYKAGELVTHAQSCIWIVGASKLADALNRGLDAHLAGAATILGISYEDAVKRKKAGDKQIANIRQAFKPCNFGFPGRMGAGKLVLQQRKQGPDTEWPTGPTTLANGKRGYKGLRFCLLMGMADVCGDVKVTEWKSRPYPPTCKKCIECAEQLRTSWLKQWPENGPYFDYVKRLDESGLPVVQHVSKRLRGFLHGQVDNEGKPINSGNAIANGFFQGLLADACKNALMAVTRECYDRTVRVISYTAHRSRYEGGASPLLGSRPILFAHDELVPEHPEAIAHHGATRVSELMEESLRLMCPDLDPAVEALPTLMRKFYKGAEPRYARGGGKPADENDTLVCWEPKAA